MSRGSRMRFAKHGIADRMPLDYCLLRPNDLAFTCERAGANSEQCTTVVRVCQGQRRVRRLAVRPAAAARRQ
jgi:hypothetical protein